MRVLVLISSKIAFWIKFYSCFTMPFFLKTHSQEAKSFTKFFWSIFIYLFLISFRYLCSVAVNSISNAVLFEWNEIHAVLFKLYGMFASEFNHSHKKRKGSLEVSLGRVLLSAALGFPKVLVPRLSQHTSDVNIECAGKSEWSKQLYSLYVTSFLEHWWILILLFWY